MGSRTLLTVALVVGTLLGSLCRAAQALDPRAIEIAHRTVAAMGGEDGFARLRTLRFDFVVLRDGKPIARRSHLWDRHAGRYRASWTREDGRNATAVFDPNDPKAGEAWLDGKRTREAERSKLLENGYALFINDTYWLLMPWKMLDPGVRLAYEGEAREADRRFDVVHLSFEPGVGLTPGDQYWVYVSQSSGLVERWDFLLEGSTGQGRTTFFWEDWQEMGGVRFSLRRRSADGRTEIRFENVRVSAEAAALSEFPPFKKDRRSR